MRPATNPSIPERDQRSARSVARDGALGPERNGNATHERRNHCGRASLEPASVISSTTTSRCTPGKKTLREILAELKTYRLLATYEGYNALAVNEAVQLPNTA